MNNTRAETSGQGKEHGVCPLALRALRQTLLRSRCLYTKGQRTLSGVSVCFHLIIIPSTLHIADLSIPRAAKMRWRAHQALSHTHHRRSHAVKEAEISLWRAR